MYLQRKKTFRSTVINDYWKKNLIKAEESKSMHQLQLAEKMKNILFCSISHELRSPVNHINGILDLIKNYYKDDEKLIEYTNIAISSINLLTSKINDILDFSLLETGALKLKHSEFNLREMMQSIENVLSFQFDHKMINFSIFIAKNVPEVLTYDHNRLKQILLNLIFNAIKYTEKGYVIIIVECFYANKMFKFKNNKASFKGNTEWQVRFSISDSGWGIEKKRQMNLFNLFSNIHSNVEKVFTL